MGINRYSLLFFLILLELLITSIDTSANWKGPNIALTANWGKESLELGFQSGNDFDYFPNVFDVSSDGYIVISDNLNGRFQLYYPNGKFKMNVIPPVNNPERWVINPVFVGNNIFLVFDKYYFYSLEGEILASIVGSGKISDIRTYKGKLYINLMNNEEKWIIFSSSGELLDSTNKTPLSLGIVKKSIQTSSGQYISIFKYSDREYTILSDLPFSPASRDAQGNLYRVAMSSEQSGEYPVPSYKVYKYNTCGKEAVSLQMPLSEFERMPDWAENAPTWKGVPIIEYGEPLIGPNGDIYTRARTKDQYKILKWTWQDEGEVGEGPDAPENFKVSNLYPDIVLLWKKPLQDPGCVTGYEIERAATSGGAYETLATIGSGTTSYTDASAESGVTYYYRMRALSDIGMSSYTPEISGTKAAAQ